MSDILFNDPARPTLTLRDEINLLAARTYVYSRLYEEHRCITTTTRLDQQSDLEEPVHPGPSLDSNRPSQPEGHGAQPNERPRRAPSRPFAIRMPREEVARMAAGLPEQEIFPDLTCRELDNVYHALINANRRYKGTEANRDPSLCRCLDEIRARLNLRPNPQG